MRHMQQKQFRETASQETEDGERERNIEAHPTETVKGTASQERESVERKREMLRHKQHKQFREQQARRERE